MKEFDQPFEFPWPNTHGLISAFGENFQLVAEGRYLKLVVPDRQPREVTVWIDESEVRSSAADIEKGASFLYPNKSRAEAVADVLAIELFECLDSLPNGTADIEFRRGGFYPVIGSELGSLDESQGRSAHEVDEDGASASR